METNELVTLIGAIVAAINTGSLLYFAWKKLKPEVKKIAVETDSEIVDAANLNLEGAKVSAQILLDRINELKKEIEEKDRKYEEQIEAMEKSRKEDLEYFRRRIKDLEKESKDYRSWAVKLHKQVVEAGLIPSPFIPSPDTEVGMTGVRPDLENEMQKLAKENEAKKK